MTKPVLKVAYLSGTRADFGLMQSCLRALHDDPRIVLEVVATGQHLDPTYGNTINDIADSGLTVVALDSVKMGGATGAEMAYVVATQIQHITAHFTENRPDLVLLLGDRGEMLAAGLAAVFLGIPVAHFHGGDRSGTVDDQLRQAITNLSHYHFPATPGAKSRLLRMGEIDANIHMLGAPGIDEIRAFTPDRDLRASLCIAPDQPIATVLFHPVVQDAALARAQAQLLLETLSNQFKGTIVVLAPNSDAGSAQIAAYYQDVQVKLESSSDTDVNFVWLTHLARPSYLSLIAQSELLIGNSSAGVVEAASLKTPVVNVGDRQSGRERNDSIFDCDILGPAITAAIAQALAYRGKFYNLYDQGGCAIRLPDVILSLDLSPSILKKPFSY